MVNVDVDVDVDVSVDVNVDVIKDAEKDNGWDCACVKLRWNDGMSCFIAR